LLAEEAPEAYKNIDRVIADLVEFGLARVVATFRPLVTFKKAQANAAAGGAKREKSWKEDRR
jgi:release factor H-coupled RctB family protein